MKYFRASLVILILCIFVNACSVREQNVFSKSSLATIEKRGTLLVGTTGDYRPLTYREPNSDMYWGFDLEVAQKIAKASDDII